LGHFQKRTIHEKFDERIGSLIWSLAFLKVTLYSITRQRNARMITLTYLFTNMRYTKILPVITVKVPEMCLCCVCLSVFARRSTVLQYCIHILVYGVWLFLLQALNAKGKSVKAQPAQQCCCRCTLLPFLLVAASNKISILRNCVSKNFKSLHDGSFSRDEGRQEDEDKNIQS